MNYQEREITLKGNDESENNIIFLKILFPTLYPYNAPPSFQILSNTTTTQQFSISNLLQKLNYLATINVNKNKHCLQKITKIFSLILLQQKNTQNNNHNNSANDNSLDNKNSIENKNSKYISLNSFQPFKLSEINSFKKTSEKIYFQLSQTFQTENKNPLLIPPPPSSSSDLSSSSNSNTSSSSVNHSRQNFDQFSPNNLPLYSHSQNKSLSDGKFFFYDI